MWNGNNAGDYTISRNYFDHIAFKNGIFETLNFPEWLELSGEATRIVKLPAEFVSKPSHIGDNASL